MKISIAMTTYNGEKYIIEQLDSIFFQSRQPDEVIICDDGSHDATKKNIENFIKKNHLEQTWHLIQNPINKGFITNFMDCIKLTTGDIVFFSDQDDVWELTKIEKMVNIFYTHHNAKAVACTSGMIDCNGKKIHGIYNWLQKNTKHIQNICFSEQIKNNYSAGLTLAVRREWYLALIPFIIDHHLTYDLPVGLVAALDKSYFIINDRLVWHRIHPNNTAQAEYRLFSRISNVNEHIRGRIDRIQQMQAMLENFGNIMTPVEYENLQNVIKCTTEDLKNIRSRKILPQLQNIANNNPMINKKIAIINILCTLFGRYNYE